MTEPNRYPGTFGRAVTILAVAVSLACGGIAGNAQSDAGVAVGPQYDSTHVYVAPANLDLFVDSFVGTFGGTATKAVTTTVTPTPSSTASRFIKTPVGLVSAFAFTTPIPAPFGSERTGCLVTDMDAAVKAARSAGADIIVAPFPDPIGKDAIIQWPGGLYMQLYWHTTAPSYAPLQHIPENRVYISPDRADAFVKSFVAFSHGQVTADNAQTPAIEISRAGGTYRRIVIESLFGKIAVFVTDGHLNYPYGRETTGYEVDDLDATLVKARSFGVAVLVAPFNSSQRRSAMVQFPGGYIAEIHSSIH